MKTKEKIADAALELYNEEGIYSISSRGIAAKMNISHGNLYYHFKHTDDIIATLYEQLSAEFDLLMKHASSKKSIDLEMLDEFIVQSFNIMYKYRFIFLHFVEVGNRIPAIQQSYFKLTKRRTKEFLQLFDHLVQNKIFRNDLSKDVWKGLVHQVFIVADFWLSNNELTNKYSVSKACNHFKELFQMMFVPYLVVKKHR